MKEYFIYKKFIDKMVENQNNTSISCLQDIYSYKDYDILLRPVLDIIRENKNQSLTSIRLKLFLRSGLKEIIDLFVNETKITPGLILDFGTFKTRDTIICGNRSEVDFENGYLVSKKIPMEMDTIFDLASTSKVFTAVAVLTLEEVGLIDVFDPVKKYVPEFRKLGDTTIYDLLKFRVKVVTDKRVDSAKTSDDALNILYTLHPVEKELNENSYTDMGAMALRIVVERVTRMQFTSFINTAILRMIGMKDTALREPNYNKHKIANENFSTIVTKEGFGITRYDNYPGTPHDKKAIAIGELQGIAPGHAGYFSTKDDMIKFANNLCNGNLLKKESVFSMSDTETGFKDLDKYTKFYGSLVYLKQPDVNNLSVYPPLSGRSFMSPGFAGTQLVVDPINNITLFVGSPRLHNRIYQIHPDQVKNIKTDEHNKKTFVLPNGEEKIVCSNYTKEKEVLVRLALDLALQYKLLEELIPTEKEMHLVRELN